MQNHYTFVRRLSALLHDQSKHGGVKHFCERCLHSYTTAELLERHKPVCMGKLKRPTRTDLPKEGENKVKFKNHSKQMKEPFVVYADFHKEDPRVTEKRSGNDQNRGPRALQLFVRNREKRRSDAQPVPVQVISKVSVPRNSDED